MGNARWEDQAEVARKYPYTYRNFWLGRTEDQVPVGYGDDRHICLVSGNRGGKGTSIIVNNLCYWQGSAVVIDPKGENATVTAARRGQGDQYCTMCYNQAVHVLDPFGAAQVDDRYRSAFNPLDALDPNNEQTIDEATRIAAALIVPREGKDDAFWDDTARAMVQALILHVLTGPEFEPAERTLLKVRDLLLRGDWETAAAFPEEDDPPHKFLWRALKRNPAFNGLVSGLGTRFEVMAEKTHDGVLQTAISNTDFLDGPGMRRVLSRSDFRLSDLKTDPRGMTIYLSLPQRYMDTHFRWLRMMVALVTTQMEITPGQPATGHRVLMILDEFAGLQRMKSIENAVAQIAGFGMKLFFVLQSLEQLKDVYKDRWETFLSNAGLKLFFSIDDNFTREYVSKLIGETEYMIELQSSNEGQSVSDSEAAGWSMSTGQTNSQTDGRSQSRTAGTSYTDTDGTSRSESKNSSEGTSWGNNVSTSHGTGTSVSEGSSSSETTQYKDTFDYLAGTILPFTVSRSHSFGGSYSTSTSYNSGSSSGQNWGGSRGSSRGTSLGTSSSHAYGQSHSDTDGTSNSTTSGNSTTDGRSGTTTRGTGRSAGTGRQQSLQKHPLVRPEEMGKLFARLDPGHPAYPGFALALIAGANPIVVKRCNYYEDAEFIDCFSPHPDHTFRPALTAEVYGTKPLLDMLAVASGGRDMVGKWVIYPGAVVDQGQATLVFDQVPPDNRRAAIIASHTGKAVKFGGMTAGEFAHRKGERFALTHEGSALTIKHYGAMTMIDPLQQLKQACADVLQHQQAREAANRAEIIAKKEQVRVEEEQKSQELWRQQKLILLWTAAIFGPLGAGALIWNYWQLIVGFLKMALMVAAVLGVLIWLGYKKQD